MEHNTANVGVQSNAVQHTSVRAGLDEIQRAVKAFVFDFDDTIADTLPVRIEATRLTFAKAGIADAPPEEFVTASRGVPLQMALDSFDGGRGAEMGLVRIYRAVDWHKEPGFLRMFDGVEALLRGLASAGYPMGVLTSKARDIVVEGKRAGAVTEMAELGIDGLFQHTIGVEDVTHPKPHPEGLERLLDHLGVAPQETLVIGDSHTDIQAAHNAGTWSCLALWGLPQSERPAPDHRDTRCILDRPNAGAAPGPPFVLSAEREEGSSECVAGRSMNERSSTNHGSPLLTPTPDLLATHPSALHRLLVR